MTKIEIRRRLVVKDYETCVGCGMCMLACSRRLGFLGFSRAAIWIRSLGGFERGFTVIVCRVCEDPPCVRVCPTEALSTRAGTIVIDYDKCIGCGLCRQVCIVGAVMWDEEANKPVICTHCGYCVYYCPHGVLTIEETKLSA